MTVSSRCKSYFSWIFTNMNFYLPTRRNWVKQLYFCLIGSFVISTKVAWWFNEETFVKQSVKLVPSVKLLFTHTHNHTAFLWKIMGKVFSKTICFCNPVLELIVDFIFASSPYMKKFVEFYFAKMNSSKIYVFLNIYSVKIYSFKAIQRSS